MRQYMIACFAIGCFTACSSQAPVIETTPQEANAPAEVGHASSSGTIKPGPDVRIRTELREPLAPGDSGALNIVFSEGYNEGQLKVKASTSEGISLLTTIDETQFDMASGTDHEWTVYFDTEEDGRHYVNFWVSVDTPFGTQTRSSSAIVKVGSGISRPKSTSSTIAVDADGTAIVRLPAQETIKEN